MKKKYFELINGLTDKDLLFHLYMTQGILCVISLILGFIFFDHFSYLETINLEDSQIFTIGIPAGLIVVMLDVLLMKWLPSSFY
ncbi:MAG: CPBP family intramembrane glutamate endopeptidase, partial [Bacillus sp. (in: firmicutes)]